MLNEPEKAPQELEGGTKMTTTIKCEHCLMACPNDGLSAVVRIEEIETLKGKRSEVKWCSRFGPDPVTCAQKCLKHRWERERAQTN